MIRASGQPGNERNSLRILNAYAVVRFWRSCARSDIRFSIGNWKSKISSDGCHDLPPIISHRLWMDEYAE
jgi:hypothetical protein